MTNSDPLGLKSYTLEARKKNLARGTQVKEAIKQMRLDLKARKIDPYKLISGNDDEHESMVRRLKIGRVLLMMPGVGPVTRDELLGELGVASDDRLIALTYERREALAALLKAVLEPEASAELPRT